MLYPNERGLVRIPKCYFICLETSSNTDPWCIKIICLDFHKWKLPVMCIGIVISRDFILLEILRGRHPATTCHLNLAATAYRNISVFYSEMFISLTITGHQSVLHVFKYWFFVAIDSKMFIGYHQFELSTSDIELSNGISDSDTVWQGMNTPTISFQSPSISVENFSD